MLMNVASTALIWGDFSGSRGLLEEALRIASRLDDRVAQFYLLDALAYHSACTGLARTGAQLLGAGCSSRSARSTATNAASSTNSGSTRELRSRHGCPPAVKVL